MPNLLPPGRQPYVTSSGAPLAGGKLFTYEPGTLIPRATYADSLGTVPNTNPVVMNARGEATIFWNGAYRAILTDAAGAVIWDVDGIQDIGVQVTAAVGPYVTQAAASALAAGTARDAAQAAQRIFATAAAGDAGTIAGQYYYVVSASSANTLELWLHNGAGGTDTGKRFPSSAAVNEVHATAVPNVEYAIQDSNDNASEYVEPATGKRFFLAIDAESINGIARYRLNKATRGQLNLKASYVHHISYGQSLSLGNGGGGGDLCSLTTVDNGFYDCVMFNANGVTTAGPRAQEGLGTAAQNHASFVPFVERPTSGSAPSGNFETPLGNALRMVKRLVRDEDGIAPTDYDYILIGSAPGQSNTAIAGLAKGTSPYTNLTNDVTFGLSLATAAGKSYAVDAVYWSQGETDISGLTARLTYKNALLQLYTDLNTDIKAITGQTHDIKLIAYQCSTSTQTNPNIALAQLDAAKANPSIILATALYACEHADPTNLHLSAFGYAQLGAYFGFAEKRTVVDGDAWANLYPTRLTRQGTVLEIEFPDTGYPLTLSNTLFPTQTNSGFTAVNNDGITNNPIVSVTVTGPRRVRVVLTNALPGFLRYGFASWGGNLHNTCDVDPGTAKQAFLYRPCLTFDEAFA